MGKRGWNFGLIKHSVLGRYWPAGELKEGDAATGKWQELTPTLSNACAVFPHDDTKVQAQQGDYAWALWRPYSYCERKGQIFLGRTDFHNEVYDESFCIPLPKTAFGRIAEGMDVEVIPEIPAGKRYAAKVSAVDRLLNAASGTFVTILELPNPNLEIPAGVTCEARFPEAVREGGEAR
jgi:hypothetical protein